MSCPVTRSVSFKAVQPKMKIGSGGQVCEGCELPFDLEPHVRKASLATGSCNLVLQLGGTVTVLACGSCSLHLRAT